MGMRPIQSISELMKKVKGESSKWINEKGFSKFRFSWQQGYGAFSYSKSQVPSVIKYIQNQRQHIEIRSLKNKCEELLKRYNLESDDKYL